MSDNDQLQQIAHLRREYTKGGLRRRDLPAEPLTLFERWLGQACDARLADPTAMVVATVDDKGNRTSVLYCSSIMMKRPGLLYQPRKPQGASN